MRIGGEIIKLPDTEVKKPARKPRATKTAADVPASDQVSPQS